MKNSSRRFKAIISAVIFFLTSTIALAQFQFVSPMPGSKMSDVNHNIILRNGSLLDASSLKKDFFTIHGSKSGLHDFEMTLSRDSKTIILQPVNPYSYDEEVTVSINAGIRLVSQKELAAYLFTFSTHREYTADEKERLRDAKNVLLEEELSRNGFNRTALPGKNEEDLRDITGGFTIVNNSNPTPGEIFYDSWGVLGFDTKYDGYNIIEPNGDSIYNSAMRTYDFDFDINASGYLSVYNTTLGSFDILDSNYNKIDEYYPANGYDMDVHEFTMTADGNAWFIADDPEIVDMSVYNANYCHNATVTGTVIQELDPDKNLIFEWNSFDHVAITETQHQNLANCAIDYMHTNSLDLDASGNILVSNRHLDQIFKLNASTGNFIWRMGGVNNEFTWVNEPEPFTYQHCARVLPDGHMSVWDNGNYHSPTHSMAKEYVVDETNKIATLVWSYQPKTYSNTNAYWFAMGSVQLLSNGNRLINGGWDYSSNQSNFYEVTSAGTVVWELKLNNPYSLVSYRVAKHNWNPCAPVNPGGIEVKKITDSSAKIIWKAVSNATSYDLQFRKVGNATWKLKHTTATTRKLNNLKPDKKYEFQLRAYCSNGYVSDWSAPDTFKTLPLRLAQYSEPFSSIALSPNPVSDVLNIEFTVESDQLVAISIRDLEGKIISTVERQLYTGVQSMQFNEQDLPAGIYLLELKSGEQTKVVKFAKE